jgi:hypothetical protein
MITIVTDIGAQAPTKLVVALAYLALVRRLAGSSYMPPGFGHRTPHFGVLSSGARLCTLPLLHDPELSIALVLFGQTLAFVCAQLALVGRLLTIGGDPVPLVGDPVSFVGGPLAPVELILTQRKRGLTLVRLARSDGGTVANHTLIKRLRGGGAAIARARGRPTSEPQCTSRTNIGAIRSPTRCTGIGMSAWDGDNPPPKPGPPIGLYCDPATLTNCRIGDHP